MNATITIAKSPVNPSRVEKYKILMQVQNYHLLPDKKDVYIMPLLDDTMRLIGTMIRFTRKGVTMKLETDDKSLFLLSDSRMAWWEPEQYDNTCKRVRRLIKSN